MSQLFDLGYEAIGGLDVSKDEKSKLRAALRKYCGPDLVKDARGTKVPPYEKNMTIEKFDERARDEMGWRLWEEFIALRHYVVNTLGFLGINESYYRRVVCVILKDVLVENQPEPEIFTA